MNKIEKLLVDLLVYVDEEFLKNKSFIFSSENIKDLIHIFQDYNLNIVGGNFYYKKDNILLNIDSLEGLFVYNWFADPGSNLLPFDILIQNEKKLKEMKISEQLYFEVFFDEIINLKELLETYSHLKSNQVIDLISKKYDIEKPKFILLNKGESYNFLLVGCKWNKEKVDTLSILINRNIQIDFHTYIEEGYLRKIEGYSFGEDWPEKIETIEFFEIDKI